MVGSDSFGHGKLACRICGGAVSVRFNRAGSNYLHCRDCGALLKELSEEQYRAIDVSYDPGVAIEDITAEETGRRLNVSGAVSELRRSFEKFSFDPKGKKLLDIGCGSGRYLVAGQTLGMSAVGIEPSLSHSAAGRRILGLDIRSGYFDKKNFQPNEFDIVVISHVLEHIYRPAEFLKDAYSLLRPGGIVLIFTPNAANPIARLSGRHWSMLEPLDHVSLFSPRSARSVCPAGAKCTVWTSEYHWEPIVTVLVSIRNALRGDRKQSPTAGVGQRQAAMRGRKPLTSAVRMIFSAASYPVWLYDQLATRGACIAAAYQRPG